MPLPLRDRSFSDDEPIKLSICSIAFNHRSFIEECLEGFLDQVCDFRVEIVIYDDASTDGTAEIIRSYEKQYPTIIRTILQKDNLYSKGVNPYYGYVIPAARGDYLAFCDGDDFWSDPNKLARQVAVLEAEPDTALTYGRVQAITDEGVIADYKGGAECDLTSSELKAAPSLNTLTACFRNIFRDAPPSLFVRTSTIGDLTVWAMLGYHGGGRFLPDLPPANYRIHASGLISMQNRERQLFMTALTHFHLAAFHHEQADEIARQISIKSTLEYYNQLGFETVVSETAADQPPKTLFKLWRRAVKRQLREKFKMNKTS
ncbi:glycosyltransferase family A protein [uncultured Roseobacter sp.]|uniref:glycosyltransferase family 2 protein n=1 Tax=uncultured Roseobacter sp. TaxID=114847 RepID=UPI002626484A|nr:glycosyltransferase family A protein [uncultured Roseobacter sp.]